MQERGYSRYILWLICPGFKSLPARARSGVNSYRNWLVSITANLYNFLKMSLSELTLHHMPFILDFNLALFIFMKKTVGEITYNVLNEIRTAGLRCPQGTTQNLKSTATADLVGDSSITFNVDDHNDYRKGES